MNNTNNALYEVNTDHLTLRQIRDLLTACQRFASWAAHGATCRGYTGLAINARGEKLTWEAMQALRPEERILWYQDFDAQQCSCGLEAVKNIMWGAPLKKVYAKPLLKAVRLGYTASLEDRHLKMIMEIEQLRAAAVEAQVERDKAEARADKLQRRLDHIQKTAGGGV